MGDMKILIAEMAAELTFGDEVCIQNLPDEGIDSEKDMVFYLLEDEEAFEGAMQFLADFDDDTLQDYINRKDWRDAEQEYFWYEIGKLR